MRIASIILLLATLIAGCCPTKLLKQSSQNSTEVRTEYREVLHTDTLLVELPVERIEIMTADTVSSLSISVANSRAWLSGGILHHSLLSSGYKPPVVVQYKDVEVVRDSIVYREVIAEVGVRLPLTKWQKFLQWSGGIGWAIAVFVFGFWLKRKIRG